MSRGDLYVVSAPSGAGKTTIIDEVLASELAGKGRLEYAVSFTTRAPRGDEKDGVDYTFVDEETFRSKVEAGDFIEWAKVHGHLYGTAKSEVVPLIQAGTDVIIDIDVQGAERIFEVMPEAVGIFIVPPGFSTLVRRLRDRGLDEQQEIARRLGVSLSEIKHYTQYRYVIINDRLAKAVNALAAIITEKRHRLERMQSSVQEIIRLYEEELKAV